MSAFMLGINIREILLSHSSARIQVSSIKGIYIRSYMSAHVLLNLLNVSGKVIKCEACRAFYNFFAASLIN